MQPGRKRSGTHVIRGQQLAKRSRENLCVQELPALKPKLDEQQTNIEVPIEVDSEEEPEEIHDMETLVRELKAKQDYKTLEDRRNYIKKSIGCSVEGAMSETVKNGLATLPKLDSEVLEGGLEGEAGSLDSILVETNQERLKRVGDWVKAAQTGKITTHST